jgi:hypothetical protein
MVQNLLKRYMGHSAGSGSVLWAVLNQLRIWYRLYPMYLHKHQPCIHLHVAMYPDAWDHGSCLHVHIAMISQGPESTCMWSLKHMQDLIMHSGPQSTSTSLSIIGRCAELDYVLSASVPSVTMRTVIGNSVKSYHIPSIFSEELYFYFYLYKIEIKINKKKKIIFLKPSAPPFLNIFCHINATFRETRTCDYPVSLIHFSSWMFLA